MEHNSSYAVSLLTVTAHNHVELLENVELPQKHQTYFLFNTDNPVMIDEIRDKNYCKKSIQRLRRPTRCNQQWSNQSSIDAVVASSGWLFRLWRKLKSDSWIGRCFKFYVNWKYVCSILCNLKNLYVLTKKMKAIDYFFSSLSLVKCIFSAAYLKWKFL